MKSPNPLLLECQLLNVVYRKAAKRAPKTPRPTDIWVTLVATAAPEEVELEAEPVDVPDEEEPLVAVAAPLLKAAPELEAARVAEAMELLSMPVALVTPDWTETTDSIVVLRP